MRWISWIAVSSKPQHERESPKAQRRDNLTVIERHGGVLVAELEVPGESRSLPSFEVAERELSAYAELRQLLNARSADAIVFLDTTRLGRTTPLATSVMHECLRAGVALYDRSAPPSTMSAAAQRADEGQLLMNSIRASMSELEIKRLVKRRRVGMRARVNDGEFPGQIPFGYVRTFAPDGSSRAVIDEDAAETIRRIFELAHEGESIQQIARAMNDIGGTTPNGGNRWHISSVRAILYRAHVYAGYVEMVDSEIGNVRSKGRHEPIISEEMAAQVLDELRANKKSRGRKTRLFSGVVTCNSCGGKMITATRRYVSIHGVETKWRVWQCGRGKREREAYPGTGGPMACPGSYIREDYLVEALRAFVRWAREGVNMDEIVAKVPVSNSDGARRAEVLTKRLSDLEAQRERLIDLVQRGIASAGEIEPRMVELDKGIAAARSELNELKGMSAETAEERRLRLLEFMMTADDIFEDMPTTQANTILRRTLHFYVAEGKVDRIDVI